MFILTLLFITSCSKDNSSLTQIKQHERKAPTGYVSPTSTQIDSIGILHNERLNAMLDDYDYSGSDYESYAETLFKSYDVNTDIWPEGVNQQFEVMTNSSLIDSFATLNMKLLMNSVENGLDSLTTFSEVQSFCSARKSYVTSTSFSQYEKDFCYIYLFND